MKNINILVIDKDSVVRDEITKHLEKHGYLVYESEDERKAWTILEQKNIQLIIIDWNLLSGKGEEFCYELHKERGIPFIIVSTKTKEEEMIKGLMLGADDYIFKPYSIKNVFARVKVVLRRYADKEEQCIFNDGYLRYEPERRLLYKEGVEVHLTPTEYKLFQTFVMSPNHIFSRNQLISSALGGDFDGYDRSIDSYIKGLRHKIEPDRKKPVYIKTVHGVGYRFQSAK